MWMTQKRKKASMPALVMPMDSGMWFGMSVYLWPKMARRILATRADPEYTCTPNQIMASRALTPTK